MTELPRITVLRSFTQPDTVAVTDRRAAHVRDEATGRTYLVSECRVFGVTETLVFAALDDGSVEDKQEVAGARNCHLEAMIARMGEPDWTPRPAQPHPGAAT